MEDKKMKLFQTKSDIGSISIRTRDVKFHFSNGFGDTYENTVEVFEDRPDPIGVFLDVFEVFTEAYLCSYDCEPSENLYTFKKGRWAVYRIKEKYLRIIKWE